MPEPDPNRSDADNRLGRVSKNAAFLMMMVLMLLLAVQFVRNQEPTRTEITYTNFMRQLSTGNLFEVTVIDRKIEGELRAPIMEQELEVTQFEVTLPSDVTDGLLEAFEANDVIIKAESPEAGWGTILIGVLPWLLFIAFWIWIFRTMQGGGNRAFQFGRSKAKLLSADTPKVTFSDVAGADEAKEELQEVIEFLKDPAKFSRLGGRLPKGVLLVGPPGTGKTLLARAVAGEAGRPFFQMSGSDFVEMFVGVGASRVRDLFEQGKAHRRGGAPPGCWLGRRS